MRRALFYLACGWILSGCGGGQDSPALSPAPELPLVRSGPDPLFGNQWHLNNTGQSGGIVGMDLGLTGVQETGRGILMAFIDGPVQIAHPDLVGNLLTLNGKLLASDPSPPPAPLGASKNTQAGGWDDAHGTAVVGIAVASAHNSLGGRGVAPHARFVAFDGVSTGAVTPALRMALQLNADIVNNSWGALDPEAGQGKSYQRADPAWQEAVDRAIQQGRQGRGTVVVFAAGNGGPKDDSNRDAYANHPGVLTIGAIDDHGRPPFYAEQGVNILVSAPSMGALSPLLGRAEIWTTDLSGPRGFAGGVQAELSDYTAFSGGTSASAPMVSGVVALMLEAQPALGWRDVRWLLARTAKPAVLAMDNWGPSPMTMHGYHPQVGFGRVHAGDAVLAAKRFTGLPPEQRCDSGWLTVGQAIGDEPAPALQAQHRLNDCIVRTVESVQVMVTIDHPYAADLEIVLTSPMGHHSLLGRPHLCRSDAQGSCGDLSQGWTFHSVRHMGESAQGSVSSSASNGTSAIWQLQVKDAQNGDTGVWQAWRLVVTGH